jgi:pilus assembly protein Flp/PilA
MLKQYVNFQVWLATQQKNNKTKGQSLAEYGLVLALIAVVCIAALTTLGGNVKTMLEGLATTIKGVKTSS